MNRSRSVPRHPSPLVTRRLVAALLVGLLAIAACSGEPGPSLVTSSGRPAPGVTSTATATATASDGATTPEPPGSAAPSASPVAMGSRDPSVCVETREPAVVTVSIDDFEFEPATIEAETGEVITFSNKGFESHNATLDSGACATPTLETAGRDGLVFATTGEYPFHCTVHTWMTGTIVISASAKRHDGAPTVSPSRAGRSVALHQEQRGA